MPHGPPIAVPGSKMPHTDLILAVETSSRTGSIALGNGDVLLVERAFSGPFRHSAEVFPLLGAILKDLQATPDDLSQVFLSLGPGSFTGLRIAVTLAKAMHLAHGVRIVAVDTLDVIAANVHPGDHAPPLIAPVLDAKRGRFFVAGYRRRDRKGAGWERILQDSLMTAPQILDWCRASGMEAGILGDGLVVHQHAFEAAHVRILDACTWSPRASSVYRLGLEKARAGKFEDPLLLVPSYLIPPEVTPKKGARDGDPGPLRHD